MITFSLRINLPSSLVSSESLHFLEKTVELKISNRQTDEEIGNITLDFGIPSDVSPRNRLQDSLGEFCEKGGKFKERGGSNAGVGISMSDHRRGRSQSVNDQPLLRGAENNRFGGGKSGVAMDFDFQRRISVASFQSTDNAASGMSAEESMIVEKKPRFNAPLVSADFAESSRSDKISRRRKTGFAAVIIPPSVLFEETQLDCVSISSKSLESCGCSSNGDQQMGAASEEEESIHKMDEICDDIETKEEPEEEEEEEEVDERDREQSFSEERESSSDPKPVRRRKQGISGQGREPYKPLLPPSIHQLEVVQESPRNSRSFETQSTTSSSRTIKPSERRKCSDFESFTSEFTKLCALRGRSSLSAEISPYIKESNSDMVICKICEYVTKSELSMKRHVSKTHTDWRQDRALWKKVSAHHRSKVYSKRNSRTSRRTGKSKSSDASKLSFESPSTSSENKF